MEHTTRELSQKLHDAGFRGEHTWSWMGSCIDGKPFCGSDENSVDHKRICPAYTFTELWRVLPDSILISTVGPKFRASLYAWKSVGITGVGYEGEKEPHSEHAYPAEAVGLLLLWLIEQGLFATGGE